MRIEIYGKKQNGKSLHEYYKRLKKLCVSYPQHQIFKQLCIQYFYKEVNPWDRSMIDATNGVALTYKILEAARQLITNIASNTKKLDIRIDI